MSPRDRITYVEANGGLRGTRTLFTVHNVIGPDLLMLCEELRNRRTRNLLIATEGKDTTVGIIRDQLIAEITRIDELIEALQTIRQTA